MCVRSPDRWWITSREECVFVGWVDANRSRMRKVDTPFVSFGKKYSKSTTSRGTLVGYKWYLNITYFWVEILSRIMQDVFSRSLFHLKIINRKTLLLTCWWSHGTIPQHHCCSVFFHQPTPRPKITFLKYVLSVSKNLELLLWMQIKEKSFVVLSQVSETRIMVFGNSRSCSSLHI